MSNLSERQFGDFVLRHETQDAGERRPRNKITAWDPQGGYAGHMEWHGTSKRVLGIEVVKEHRRQGLASAMWNWGQEMRPRPVHSNQRTDQGDAWARAVGGRLPRRTHA